MKDVLDQFSANAPSSSTHAAPSQVQKSQDAPSASGPGRPSKSTEMPPVPDGPHPGESEEDFIKRLTAELSTAMSSFSSDVPEDVSKATPEDLARMGKELEEFTLAMEKEGIQPEDLLKAILGEQEGAKLAKAAHEDADRASSQPSSPSASKSRTASPETTTKPKSPSTSSKPRPDPATAASFEDTIRRTMERMETSSAAATSASQTAKSEEDMLADLLKSLGSSDPSSSSDPSNPDDLSAMFLTMMQQLTSKDMLYEPMRDLHQKFPGWLRENASKISADDKKRYEEQQRIVAEIVGKFEERGYSDDDSKARDFVWERMQKMQEQGAPPEELVENPLLGAGGGGLGGMGLPGMGDEGCPTQ